MILGYYFLPYIAQKFQLLAYLNYIVLNDLKKQNKKQNQVQKKLIKNSKVDMTNNDENVVRTRLLLDGDGTGDDRRLNNISKMVRSVQQQIKFLIIKSIRKLSSPPVSNTYISKRLINKTMQGLDTVESLSAGARG